MGGVDNRAVATVILDAQNGTAQVGYGETPNEECDCGDGTGPLPPGCPGPNGDSTYGGCTAQCTWGPFCGDGSLQAPPAGPEQCDLGKQNGAPDQQGDRCSIACQSPRVCGDGIADTDLGEQCDLGPNNGIALDGQMQPSADGTAQIYCTTNCTIPPIIF
jgi:hypothetical protein